jgi:hypothetical protein
MTERVMFEQGPEAAAALARMTEREIVFRGEGGHVEVGTDGPTFCVALRTGTLLSMLGDEDVSEADRRRSLSVRRFVTRAERDAYIDAQPWRDSASGRRRLVRTPEPTPRHSPSRFELSLYAGLSNSDVRAVVENDGQRQFAVCTIQIAERPPIGADVTLSSSEWARFDEELRLLAISDWHEYGTNALDGLMWSLVCDGARKTAAGGCNAYPPDGTIEITPQFTRCLLATERVFGRELWPGFPIAEALRDIPDDRDRVEHAILSATRTWAADQQVAGVDPRRLNENDVERALTPYLDALVPARKQRHIKGLLNDWPGVGRLDIEIDSPTAPAWLELKWAKSASTLHNCLWDAAKLAVAQREGRASHGYLLAGAPDLAWNDARGPTHLFHISAHHGASLVDEHLTWWKGWFDENANSYPLRLPTPIVTVPVGRVFMRGSDNAVAGEAWTLRLARVHAPGQDAFLPQPRRGDSSRGATTHSAP